MRPDGERRTMRELGFCTWLTDVVWYHYKGVILFSLAAALLGGGFLLLRDKRPRPDAIVMVLTVRPLGFEVYEGLRQAAEAHLSDENGDGKVSAAVTEVLLSDGDYSAKLAMSFMHADTLVYVMDTEAAAQFADEPGRYAERHIPLAQAAWAARLGLTGENALIACVKAKPYAVSLDDEAYYARARAVIRGLVE